MDHVILGNSIASWLLAAAVVVAAVVAVKLVAWLSRRFVEPMVARTRNGVDNIIYYSLIAPLKLGIILLGIWIALDKLVYPSSWGIYVDRAFTIMIVLDVTWVFARLSSMLLERMWRRHDTSPTRKMMPVARRALLIVIWILGVVTALSNVGVNIGALWGTLGIGGIVIALAAQDTIKNVFGAFTIVTDKPFGIGDSINVNGVEGTVVDVSMRSTRILGADKRITSYPNYKITESPIVNISSEPKRRVVVKLALSYDTGVDRLSRALEVLRSLPQSVEGVSRRAEDVKACFTEYAESALIVTLYYNIERPADIAQTMSEMNMAIMTAFAAEGLQFAYPTQKLVMQKDAAAGDDTGAGNRSESSPSDDADGQQAEEEEEDELIEDELGA